MTWLAQESGATSVLQFAQYGVLGLVIVAALFGWIWFKPAVDRLQNDLEHYRTQLDALVQVYEQKVIPVLVEANRILSRLAEQERR